MWSDDSARLRAAFRARYVVDGGTAERVVREGRLPEQQEAVASVEGRPRRVRVTA